MNAEQRFDEFDRVVADGRNLVAGFQTACHQIIGKTVGVALDLGEGHAPRAVGDGDAIGEAPRRALEEIADGDPPDAARPRHAAGRCEVSHAYPLSFVIPGCAVRRRPGIHIHRLWLWIPGSPRSLSSGAHSRDPLARPGMTASMPDPKNLP